MARHRHSPSPARNTACHQDQGRDSCALPNVSQSKCACSRTDFIPSWLQHVQTSYNDTSREILPQASPGPGEAAWHPNGIPTVRIQSRYGTGGYQSSDLFIQDTPSPPPLAGQTSSHYHHEFDQDSAHGQDLDDGRKGHYLSNPHVSTPSEASPVVYNDIFVKQPRRKTRKDRYNTVKSKGSKPSKQQTRRSATRISKNGKLRSSRDIMVNFKSSAITNPNERITLKPSFTPGLFVNGRSSAPITDLVFNEIPSPGEGGKPTEDEEPSRPAAGKPKGDTSRQEEIELLSNTLRRLTEDYPPPNLSDTHSSRANSTTSCSDFQSIQLSTTYGGIRNRVATGKSDATPRQREGASGGAKDNGGEHNRPSSQHGNLRLHIRSIYSLPPTTEPYFSDVDMLQKPLPSNDGSIQWAQSESAARHQGLTFGQSDNERSLGGHNPTKSVEYEDKGVMVSPWMHQRTEKYEPGIARGNANINSRTNGYSPYLPHVSDLTTGMKDIYRPHGDASPAWAYGLHNIRYPLTSYLGPDSSSVGELEFLRTVNSQPKDACNIDMPAQLANSDQSFQSSRKPRPDSNALYSSVLHTIDDAPHESLREYIDRMEREIFGSDDPSMPWTDDTLLSARDICQTQIPRVPQADISIETSRPNNHPLGIELKQHLSPRNPIQHPIREDLYRPSRQYQQLPYLGQSLNDEIESELASFWLPNQMLWC
ncbi:hypothetical protein V8C35DRAFT_248342 [Trichoderma chlorosporum]